MEIDKGIDTYLKQPRTRTHPHPTSTHAHTYEHTTPHTNAHTGTYEYANTHTHTTQEHHVMLHQYTLALTSLTWNKPTPNEGHSHKHVHRQIIPTRCFRALYLRIRASTSCLAASACIFCTMSVRAQISKQMKCVLQHSIKISYMHTCTQYECMKYKDV